jgi:peptidoglycan/xylan/chitin deacetylase (PgdA/CDA1 family)
VTAARRLGPAARRAAGLLAGSAVAVRTTAPAVALTFDDGPEPGGTDRVLTALADAGATATFFVLLTRVRRYRSLLDDVLAGGHEIGLHGEDHRPLPELPPGEVAGTLAGARAQLEDATGRPVRWYRPPYGRTWDWKDVAPAERLAKAVVGARPGAIVLAHDGFAGAEDAAVDGPAPVLDRGVLITGVLSRYADLGLSARSYGEVLATGSPVRDFRFPG